MDKEPAAAYYRCDAANVFYTWPQCDTPKEIVLSKIVDFWRDKQIDFVLVCHEKHEDGHIHLHAVSSCRTKKNMTRASWADNFAGKHGDYSATRNLKASVDYVMKDKDWIVYPEGYDFAKRWENCTPGGRKRKVSEVIAHKIDKGKTFDQLLLTGRWNSFFLMHAKKAEEYEARLKKARANADVQSSLAKWHSLVQTDSHSPTECILIEWLNSNLSGVTRPMGMKQLYLYGPTEIGKSHLLNQLRTYFRVYSVCMEEDWMDDYDDDAYDLIVFEEFKGQKQITWMNKFIDGQIVALRRKGKSAYLKKKNLPVMLVSNYSLDGAYKNSSEEKLAPLARRLTMVNAGFDHSVAKPINLF